MPPRSDQSSIGLDTIEVVGTTLYFWEARMTERARRELWKLSVGNATLSDKSCLRNLSFNTRGGPISEYYRSSSRRIQQHCHDGDNSSGVVLQVLTGPSGGVLNGTKTVNAVNGLANFSCLYRFPKSARIPCVQRMGILTAAGLPPPSASPPSPDALGASRNSPHDHCGAYHWPEF